MGKETGFYADGSEYVNKEDKKILEQRIALANELERKARNLKEARDSFKDCISFAVHFQPSFNLYAQCKGQDR